MFDAHFHLNYLPRETLDTTLRQAHACGVTGGLAAGVWPHETAEQLSWATEAGVGRDLFLFYKRRSPAVIASKIPPEGFALHLAHGLHPLAIAERWFDTAGTLRSECRDQDFATFEHILLEYRNWIWALGETGFDLSRGALHTGMTKETLAQQQEEAFVFCMELALREGIPVIVHSRDAWKRTLDTLLPRVKRGLRAMIHCYGGPADALPQLARLGVMVSFGGVATWKRAARVHEAVKACQAEILLLETDSPDLPPERADGTRPEVNSPSELPAIARHIAALRGETVETLVATADANLRRYLG